MALAANSLTSDNGDADGTSYNTASIAPADNALVLVAILSRRQGADPSQPTLSGGGMTTWTHVNGSFFSTSGTQRARVDVFRALEASPGTAAVTIDYGGVTHSKSNWSIVEFSGVDTSGTNGSGAIVQSDITSGTSTGGTVTLSAFGSVNNAGYGAWAHNANEVTTHGTSFTELHDLAGANPASALQTEWRVNDNTVDASWATSSLYGGVALEIKEAVAGGSTYEKTGGGISAMTGSGADAVTFTESGLAAAPFTAAGADATTFAETGLAAAPMTGSGADAVTYAETGTGILGMTGSGAKEYTPAGGGTTYTKTGLGAMPMTGSGADAVIYGETGTGETLRVASGVKAMVFTEAGAGVLAFTGSGFNDSAQPVTDHWDAPSPTASHFDAPTPGVTV